MRNSLDETKLAKLDELRDSLEPKKVKDDIKAFINGVIELSMEELIVYIQLMYAQIMMKLDDVYIRDSKAGGSKVRGLMTDVEKLTKDYRDRTLGRPRSIGKLNSNSTKQN
jgi:hypothetical protein